MDDRASDNTWVTWTITSLVQSWQALPGRNFGLMLRGSSEGGDYSFHSYVALANTKAAQRPRLKIEYTP